MSLPFELQKSIDRLILAQPSCNLQIAREKLTQKYQEKRLSDSEPISFFMQNKQEKLTYLATRMPATYAVCRKILTFLTEYESSIESLLDLGSGPGTVFWAAQEILCSLKKITMIEQDPDLINFAQHLFKSSNDQHAEVNWCHQSLLTSFPFSHHDLITLSYVLGELTLQDRIKILQAAWQATEKFLIVVEPGTPRGFERIREIRQFLIKEGAFILAPCPHRQECPMKDRNWCHFSQRLDRSSSHRLIKKVSLGFEDEKYSYIIASRSNHLTPSSRILSYPQKKTGHFILDLCTRDGLKRFIISKKMKTLYQKARQYQWGDAGPDLGNQNHDDK